MESDNKEKTVVEEYLRQNKSEAQPYLSTLSHQHIF